MNGPIFPWLVPIRWIPVGIELLTFNVEHGPQRAWCLIEQRPFNANVRRFFTLEVLE